MRPSCSDGYLGKGRNAAGNVAAVEIENEMDRKIMDFGEALSILSSVEETLRAFACTEDIREGQSFAMLNLANTMWDPLTFLKAEDDMR